MAGNESSTQHKPLACLTLPNPVPITPPLALTVFHIGSWWPVWVVVSVALMACVVVSWYQSIPKNLERRLSFNKDERQQEINEKARALGEAAAARKELQDAEKVASHSQKAKNVYEELGATYDIDIDVLDATYVLEEGKEAVMILSKQKKVKKTKDVSSSCSPRLPPHPCRPLSWIALEPEAPRPRSHRPGVVVLRDG